MRAKTFFLIGSAVLLFVACLTSVNAVRRRDDAEASLSALAAKHVSLSAEVERMKSRNVAAKDLHTELSRMLNVLSPPPPIVAQKIIAGPEPAKFLSDHFENDPKMETLMLRRQRAVVLLEYAPLFRALKLSPEQIKKFQDNCVKREESFIDLRAASRAQDDLGKQMAAKLQEQANADYEAAQLEVLSADGYRQMQEFFRVEPLRNVLIRGLAGAAALEGVPLTEQQGEQLLQAALNAASQDANVTGEKLLTMVDWDALDVQARQILSPAQFTLFTTAAHLSGFQARWKYQTDAVIQRALQSEAASPTNTVTQLPRG
jgi:hypothetical protein